MKKNLNFKYYEVVMLSIWLEFVRVGYNNEGGQFIINSILLIYCTFLRLRGTKIEINKTPVIIQQVILILVNKFYVRRNEK